MLNNLKKFTFRNESYNLYQLGTSLYNNVYIFFRLLIFVLYIWIIPEERQRLTQA